MSSVLGAIISAGFFYESPDSWAQGLSPVGATQACLDPDLLPSAARVPCQGILVFSPGTSAADREAIIGETGASLRHNFTLVNAAAVFVPSEGVLSGLLAHPGIVEIIPDRLVSIVKKPSNPGNSGGGGGGEGGQTTPSGVTRIGAVGLGLSGAGVGVAVVDTGLDEGHADLNVAIECFTAYSSCQDDNGHGTHVGGIIGALDNTIDVVGVAPAVTLYAVKVLNQNGSGYDSDIMAGLDWIALNAAGLNPPILVANLSLGRNGSLNDNQALRASFQALHSLGVSVVVAAGNDSSKEVKNKVPATYPEVMAVASTTTTDGGNKCRRYSGFIAADTASYFTTDGVFNASTGIGVTISAPGAQKEDINKGCFIKTVGILSLQLGGGTTRKSGTSMASPHVAGLVALMAEVQASVGLSLDPEAARSALQSTSSQAGMAPLDSPAGGYSFDGEREGIASVAATDFCAINPTDSTCL